MNEQLSRRNFLGSSLLAGAGLVLLPALSGYGATDRDSEPQSRARGIVFDEASPTTAKRGIPGVLVSNGRDIVKTDLSGRYQINVRDGDMLFVIKPSGWSAPLTQYNLPKFYYFHRPTGSPKWDMQKLPGFDLVDPIYLYKGSDPTGPLPASIDFPLQRATEPDEFKVICFGDTQVSHDRQIEWMSRGTVSELINEPDIAFGISVGDLVNVGQLHLFGPLNEVQAVTGFPWWVIPGNHDQNLLTPSDELAEEEFRATYGPNVYAFEYGPVSFLMMGNVRREPSQKAVDDPKAKPGTAHPATPPYSCGLRDDQWEFVENYIKTVPRDRQLVLVMHCEFSLKYPGNAEYTRRLLKLISGRPYTFSISGHTHIQNHWFFGKEAGFEGPGEHHQFNTICVRGAGYRGMFNELRIPTCQAEDGTPAGYSYITFTKTSYKIRYKPSRHPADYQMNIFVPPLMKPADAEKANVLANVFGGSKRSTVRMRVNNGNWLPMTLTPQADPSISWVLDAERKPESWLGSKYNPNDKPATCSHIWQASLPGNLRPGAHVLEVESVDMFDQRDNQKTMFRIREAPSHTKSDV